MEDITMHVYDYTEGADICFAAYYTCCSVYDEHTVFYL